MTLGEFMQDDRLASRIVGRADLVWLNTPDQRVRKMAAAGERE